MEYLWGRPQVCLCWRACSKLTMLPSWPCFNGSPQSRIEELLPWAYAPKAAADAGPT